MQYEMQHREDAFSFVWVRKQDKNVLNYKTDKTRHIKGEKKNAVHIHSSLRLLPFLCFGKSCSFLVTMPRSAYKESSLKISPARQFTHKQALTERPHHPHPSSRIFPPLRTRNFGKPPSSISSHFGHFPTDTSSVSVSICLLFSL